MPKRPFRAEQVILLIGLFAFIIFFWMIAFLLSSVRAGRSSGVALNPFVPEVSGTPSFTLPPTWTPTPFQEVAPSPTGTNVAIGVVPTRIYTPGPTSLPGIPWPLWATRVPRLTVVDLARIMQGESPGDTEAAYLVGWVAKNRLLHVGYGDTYGVVSHGFFGYRPDLQPSEEFLKLARQVIKSKKDPTDGCLYALSRTDITKLGVPPGRADVANGEWFFFRTWPLSGR